MTLETFLTALSCLCVFELFRLARTVRLEVIKTAEQARIVLSKAFQALDNANDVAETLEDAAGDIATVTEEARQRSKRGLLGLFTR